MKGKTAGADPELLERAVLTQKVELMQSLLDDAKARELKLRASYQKMVDWIHADGTSKPPLLSSILGSSIDGKSVDRKLESKQVPTRNGTPKKVKKSSKKQSSTKNLEDDIAEEKPSSRKMNKRRKSGLSTSSNASGYQSAGYPYNNCHLSCHLGGLSFAAVGNCEHQHPQSLNSLNTGTVFKKKPVRQYRNQGPLIDESVLSGQHVNKTSPILAAMENRPLQIARPNPSPRVVVAPRKDGKENLGNAKLSINPSQKKMQSTTNIPEQTGCDTSRTSYQISQTEPSAVQSVYVPQGAISSQATGMSPQDQTRIGSKRDMNYGSPPQGSGRSADISATNGSLASYCIPPPQLGKTPGSSHRRVNSSHSALQAILSKQPPGQFGGTPRGHVVSPQAQGARGSLSGKGLGNLTSNITNQSRTHHMSREGGSLIPSVPVESILLNTPINLQARQGGFGQVQKRESAQSQSKYIMAQSFHLSKPPLSNGVRTPGASNSFVSGPKHSKMLSTLIGTHCSTDAGASHIPIPNRIGAGVLKQHGILSQSREREPIQYQGAQLAINPGLVGSLAPGMPAISINLSAQDRDLSSIHIDASDPANVQIHLKRDKSAVVPRATEAQSIILKDTRNISATHKTKAEEVEALLVQNPVTNPRQSGSTLVTRPSAAPGRQSSCGLQGPKVYTPSGANNSVAYQNHPSLKPEAANPAGGTLKAQFQSVQITRPDRDSTKLQQRELDSSIVEESSAYTRSEYEQVQGMLNSKWTSLQEKYLRRLR